MNETCNLQFAYRFLVLGKNAQELVELEDDRRQRQGNSVFASSTKNFPRIIQELKIHFVTFLPDVATLSPAQLSLMW